MWIPVDIVNLIQIKIGKARANLNILVTYYPFQEHCQQLFVTAVRRVRTAITILKAILSLDRILTLEQVNHDVV